MNEFARYHSAVAYIDGLTNLPLSDDYMSGSTKPSVFLKRTGDFLEKLGNPHRGFKFVHIAGTAGKGTVTTMVHNALFAAHKNVGSFTSPYVTTPIEKIRVDDLYIAPEEFADIVEELKPHIENTYVHGRWGRPSYFEIYLAIALLYFKKRNCEWVVLEVGAGGRFDATNIIEEPAVAAITSIDFDHVQILGNTLLSIADNKAGIIKRGSAFFTTENRPALLKLFGKKCLRVGARCNVLPTSADYQENNRKLAHAICRHIGVSDAAEGTIETTKLPCRFEQIQDSPRIILDGAHNRSKMRSTAENIQNMQFKKMHLVIGVGAKKDATAVVKEIAPYAHSIYVTRFKNVSVPCTDPKKLAGYCGKFIKKAGDIEIFLDAELACNAALKNADKDDVILVTGSFYLAGELRERWIPESTVLATRKSF